MRSSSAPIGEPNPAALPSQRLARWPLALCCLVLVLLARVLPLPQNNAIAGVAAWCPFYLWTQQPCPFCGLTRSGVWLAHGDWRQAVWWHPLGPLVFALILAAPFFPRCALPRKIVMPILVLFVALWLARLKHLLPSPF